MGPSHCIWKCSWNCLLPSQSHLQRPRLTRPCVDQKLSMGMIGAFPVGGSLLFLQPGGGQPQTSFWGLLLLCRMILSRCCCHACRCRVIHCRKKLPPSLPREPWRLFSCCRTKRGEGSYSHCFLAMKHIGRFCPILNLGGLNTYTSMFERTVWRPSTLLFRPFTRVGGRCCWISRMPICMCRFIRPTYPRSRRGTSTQSAWTRPSRLYL